MSRRSSRFSYVAVRSEGGMLPYELLEQVGAHSSELGVKSTGYYLDEHEPLGEAQSRAWLRLVGLWKHLSKEREGLDSDEPAVAMTRRRWLLPLFQELGYGRLGTAKGNPALVMGEGEEARSFPISHLHGPVPIHLLGLGVSLDRRTARVSGAIHSSPHGLVQDFLNRSDDHLWGVVSNGLQLRLLRDSHTFTRRPYLEFDLEAIFDGELYSDFRLLWLCAHASRLSPTEEGKRRPESAPIERWFQRAKDEGIRVRDRLRDGVRDAIQRLGGGFMRHPHNSALDQALERGELSPQAYYRELLRLVYRLIFVFVAEDRGVLQPPIPEDSDPAEARARYAAQARYTKFYSTTKLRELALRRRGGPHGDRWVALRLVLGKLHRGSPELDLPGLGSALFDPATTAHLSDAELANSDLLGALRALCTFTDDAGVLRPVSWRHVGADELGSVFESLLELVPRLHRETGTLELETAAGNERKTTGSYYTPESLVECLLDSALDPVLDRACRERDKEQALLDLKVCDPACGSGHFLVAAGRRIAHRLAQVRAGDEEPSPVEIRRALRDVYARCLFGVDINPLAVELCKVSLWMEAIDPARPLPFLDGHILQGNALLGATPASIAGGIPTDAFKPIEGDDKEVAKRLRKRNRNERRGKGKVQGVQRGLLAGETVREGEGVGAMENKLAAIEAMPDDTLEATEAKERRYYEYVGSAKARAQQFVADAWCAAFIWPKDEAHEDIAPTHWVFGRICEEPGATAKETVAVVEELAREYQFFHWHLGFPQVFSVPEGREAEHPKCGWSAGFDVVLGNPPWEHIELKEKEFFSKHHTDIAKAKTTAARKRSIQKLRESTPSLYLTYSRALRKVAGTNSIIRETGEYPLCGRGRINTYSVFAELNRNLVNGNGRLGCIVPAGIAMDDTTKFFFADLVNSRCLASLFHFENEEHIFPEIHNALRFCLLTVCGLLQSVQTAVFSAFARQVEHINDPERRYHLSAEDFERINPNTRTLPTFRHRADAEINTSIYRRVPVFQGADKYNDSWNPTFRQGTHNTSSDSDQFRTREQLENAGWKRLGNFYLRKDQLSLPLYEAKMVHQLDHRFGTYEGQTQAQANKGFLPYLTEEDHADPCRLPLSRYWVQVDQDQYHFVSNWSRAWFLGWRRIARSSDIRTYISTVLPLAAIADSTFVIYPEPPLRQDTHCLIASLQSYVLDYTLRQKLGGTNCSFYIIAQLPILPPAMYESSVPWAASATGSTWILPRVLELTYTAWDLIGFAHDHGYDGPPFRWDEERRFWLRAELDAAYFHFYGLSADEVDHVMESFPLIRRRDEKSHGSYRTKEAILDLYHRMAAATADAPYETVLDPPPADPSIAHPPLTEAQKQELAPILERALAAPPLGEEEPPSESKPKSAKSKPRKTPKAKPDFQLESPSPQGAFDFSKTPKPTPPSPTSNLQSPTPLPDDPPSLRHLIALEDPSITPPMLALLRALHRSGKPLAKAALLEAANLDTKSWTRASKALLDAGMIAKQGRGRGTKYHLVT